MSVEDIKKNIDNNSDIPPKIAELVKETFSDIYEFLGERGLKKFLIENNMDSFSRNVIIRILTSATDRSLRNNANVIGYYRVLKDKSNLGRSKIVLRKNVGVNKHTLSHEAIHALGKGLGGFNIFLGEGITEFMSKTIYRDYSYVYKENVDVVSLLYSMYGNKLLKYYFTNSGSQFFYDLAKSVRSESQDKMVENIDRIDYHLINFHLMHYRKAKAPNKNMSSELKQGVNAILENYWLYKEDQIKNFEYIKDGKVDFDRFIKEMAGVYFCYSNLVEHSVNGEITMNMMDVKNVVENKLETKRPFRKNLNQLIEQLIENSHLLVGLDAVTSKKVMETIYQDISNAIINNSFKYEHGNIPDVIIDQDSETYRSLNENAKSKLLKEFLTDKDMTFAERLRTIDNIARATNISQTEMEEIIKSENSEQVSHNPNLMLGIAHKFTIVSQNLKAMEIANNQEMKNIRYVQLDFNGIQNAKGFIEINADNGNLSLIFLDTETGEISNTCLEKMGDFLPEKNILVRVCINKDKLPPEVRNFDIVFKIESIKNGNGTYLGISDNFKESNLHDGFGAFNGNLGDRFEFFNTFREDCLNRIVFDELYVDIENGKYSSNKSKTNQVGRQDFEPRYIYYDNFIEDYISIYRTFQGVDQYGLEVDSLSKKLVDRTFEFNKIPNSETEQFAEKKDRLVGSFRELVAANIDGQENETIRELKREINGIIFSINQGVKELGQSKENFLQSAVSATEGVTRIGTIEDQVRKMEQIGKTKSPKESTKILNRE